MKGYYGSNPDVKEWWVLGQGEINKDVKQQAKPNEDEQQNQYNLKTVQI